MHLAFGVFASLAAGKDDVHEGSRPLKSEVGRRSEIKLEGKWMTDDFQKYVMLMECLHLIVVRSHATPSCQLFLVSSSCPYLHIHQQNDPFNGCVPLAKLEQESGLRRGWSRTQLPSPNDRILPSQIPESPSQSAFKSLIKLLNFTCSLVRANKPSLLFFQENKKSKQSRNNEVNITYKFCHSKNGRSITMNGDPGTATPPAETFT